MLYIVLLENLLAGLDYEKKQKLISLVFKRNRQALPTSDVSKMCLCPKWRSSPIISPCLWIISGWVVPLRLTMLLVTTTMWVNVSIRTNVLFEKSIGGFKRNAQSQRSEP